MSEAIAIWLCVTMLVIWAFVVGVLK